MFRLSRAPPWTSRIEGRDRSGPACWGQLTGPPRAALVNGITAHGLELDDTFEEASLHPGVVIFRRSWQLLTSATSRFGMLLPRPSLDMT